MIGRGRFSPWRGTFQGTGQIENYWFLVDGWLMVGGGWLVFV